MHQRFSTEQYLPFPRELVFAFFANPENLPRLMPRWQRARIEEATFAPPPPRPEGTPRFPGVTAGDGTRLLLSARPFPYAPARGGWEALIENFRWNEGFCDVQMQGPFRYWRHCHSLHEAPGARGGVMVRDEVEYEPPMAPLSLPVVKAALAGTFRYRQERTAELMPMFAAAARQG